MRGVIADKTNEQVSISIGGYYFNAFRVVRRKCLGWCLSGEIRGKGEVVKISRWFRVLSVVVILSILSFVYIGCGEKSVNVRGVLFWY